MAVNKAAQEITLSETIADVYEKVTGGMAVAMGLLPGGRFQLTSANIRGASYTVFKNLPASLRDYYKPWFQQYADKEWIIYEDERYTFGDALDIYEAVGNELVYGFKVKAGERVGIAMRNYPEFLLAFLAITAVGGVAVPLNALWKSDELKYAVKDSGCKVVIGDAQRLTLCEPFAGEFGIKTILVRGTPEEAAPTGAAMWSDVLESGRTRKPARVNVKAEDEAMIMYTSGSTGFPKGVCHTQRGVGTAMKVGEIIGAVLGETEARALMAVPLFHITALSPIALCSIPTGGAVVFMRKWDAGNALKIIEKEQVTRFTGVPTMVRDILEHPDFSPEKVKTMKNMLSGGAPVPPTQMARMRSKAKKIKSGQGYGLTESMAWGTTITGTDFIKHPTSCGKPLPLLVTLRIVDPNTGKEVKEGERGEVCLKSAMIMKCYYNRPEDTKKAIDKDGYFHTGDIGKIEGGFLYILDRMKDLIIRGGENIDCSEVEAAIAQHPAVREVSVFALPDARLGEVVGAACYVTEEVTSEDIVKVAAASLAKFKVPLAINVFLSKDELPKGATGKLDKKGMRSHFSAIVEKRPIKASL